MAGKRRKHTDDFKAHVALEALLLKALARNPKDRYASAGDLARDMENCIAGGPLEAKPPTARDFVRKMIRRTVV